MKQVPSPNFNERASGVALDYIVLHYTGMRDAAGAVARMCDAAAQVSAHYMIDEDGTITQLVDESRRAWHAGKSFWRGITDINSASIGIELVNPGHEFGYRAFPAAQIAALKELMRGIIARRGLSAATALLAHSDIAPSRKEDPGELFPWQALAAEGLGLWPMPGPEDYPEARLSDAIPLLKDIGYDMSAPQAALSAFQRRFYAEKLGGAVDTEMLARLRALKRLWGA